MSTDADAWPLIGAGLVSRMTTTLRSVLDLQPADRVADAGTLVRSLYEHTVHLAWLAADPGPQRIEEWRKYDYTSRLKADADTRERGVRLFTDETRSALQTEVANMHGGDLRLVNLAVAADKHWAGKLPGMAEHTEQQSFRGFYALLYRDYSGLAHPTYRGLNPVVEHVRRGRQRVVLDRHRGDNGPYGIGVVIFALGLYVASDTLGWPRRDAITDVFERNP